MPGGILSALGESGMLGRRLAAPRVDPLAGVAVGGWVGVVRLTTARSPGGVPDGVGGAPGVPWRRFGLLVVAFDLVGVGPAELGGVPVQPFQEPGGAGGLFL